MGKNDNIPNEVYERLKKLEKRFDDAKSDLRTLLKTEIALNLEDATTELKLFIKGIHKDVEEIKDIVKSHSYQIQTIMDSQSYESQGNVDSRDNTVITIGSGFDLLSNTPAHLRKTYEALLIIDDDKATASEVANKTGKSRSLESDYLNQLVTLRLVKKKQDGRKVYFSISSESK